MPGKRRNADQIMAILRRGEEGGSIPELCREVGISEATFFRWKSKYSGMTHQELQKVKEMEAENGQLKRIVADQALQINALKNVVKKKW